MLAIISQTSSSLRSVKLLLSAIVVTSSSGDSIIAVANFVTLSLAIFPSANNLKRSLKCWVVKILISYPSLLISLKSYARRDATGVGFTSTSLNISSKTSASNLFTS